MGTEDLHVSFKVLQDTVGDLSKRLSRSEETSKFLEQRVRELEKCLAGTAPKRESPNATPKTARQEDELGREQERESGKAVAQRLDIAPEGAGSANDELQGAELDDEEQDIPLEGSIWCAALFVGSPCLNWWGSAWLLFCIGINVAVQAIFCIVVAANFIESEFSQEELDGLKAWRLRIAHDHRFVGAEGVSLGSRVCGLDPTLELSTDHANKVDLIRSYIPRLDPSLSDDPFSMDQLKSTFDGSIMCMLALTCWTLTMGKELMGVLDLLGATLSLPRVGGRCVHVTNAEDGSIQVKGIGWGSKAFMLVTSALRFGISTLLLAMGCMYLCYISSMQDLLLNAVALEFVMMVDELVFEALAPRRARQVLAKVEPLKLPPWRKFKALDMRGVVVFATLVLCLLGFYLGPLETHKANLVSAHELMCGGFKDFSVVEDRLGMVHMENLKPFDIDTQYNNLNRPWDRAVQEQIDKKAVPDFTLFPQGYGFKDVVGLEAATLPATTRGIYSLRFVGCHDALDFTVTADPQTRVAVSVFWDFFEVQRRVWLNNLNDRGQGRVSGSSCAELAPLCATDEAMSAVCPVTCGCDSLVNGSIDQGLGAGCPGVCLSTLDPRAARSTSCEDARVGDSSDPKWLTLAKWARWFPAPANETLLEHGCAGILATMQGLCHAPSAWEVDDSPFRTSFTQTDPFSLKLFTYLCPITCNCGGRGGANSSPIQPMAQTCPDQCVCAWPYTVQPPQAMQKCTVQHYTPGVSLETVQADGPCCYLMQEHSRQIAATLGGSATAMFTIADTLCRPCYSSCLERLRTLRVVGAGNQTYPSDYFWTVHGQGAPDQSRWRSEHQCP